MAVSKYSILFCTIHVAALFLSTDKRHLCFNEFLPPIIYFFLCLAPMVGLHHGIRIYVPQQQFLSQSTYV